MLSGKFERPPLVIAPCGNRCGVCLGKWGDIHIPVYEDSVVDFLSSAVAAEHLPMPIDRKKKISSMLWGNTYWIKLIFDQQRVKRANVDALFLSLRANGILVIEKKSSIVRWNIARSNLPGGGSNQGRPQCASDWKMFVGINTFPRD